jgi:hypothetical protein
MAERGQYGQQAGGLGQLRGAAALQQLVESLVAGQSGGFGGVSAAPMQPGMFGGQVPAPAAAPPPGYSPAVGLGPPALRGVCVAWGAEAEEGRAGAGAGQECVG